jgi:hypothetical protein
MLPVRRHAGFKQHRFDVAGVEPMLQGKSQTTSNIGAYMMPKANLTFLNVMESTLGAVRPRNVGEKHASLPPKEREELLYTEIHCHDPLRRHYCSHIEETQREMFYNLIRFQTRQYQSKSYHNQFCV